MFEGEEANPSDAELAFRFAIKNINDKYREPNNERLLQPEIRYLNKGDTYDAMKSGELTFKDGGF